MPCLSRYPLLLLLGVLLHPAPLPAEEMAVNAQVFNGYARERLPDGTFKPEFYVFGEGGCWTRPVADPWMDKLTFPKIGHIIAGPLAKQNYIPALKSADAGLLIIVFWGSTEGSYSLDHDRSWEREMLEIRNARILGYTEALDRAYFAPHMSFAQDTMAEVGNNRYFVVLQAYDFKTAVKEKKLRPLWTTRLSVGESGDFAPVLEQMVWGAARYFGQDTRGLKRHEPTLNATVKLGPLEVIEIVPPK
jgi:hypothetical protein